MDEKRKIRLEIKRLFLENKKQLPALSKAVIRKLEASDSFISSGTIALFWSLPDEVETHLLINKWYKQKQILLPSIQGENIELREYKGQENLNPGMRFQIPEPSSAAFEAYNEIDTIITPGVAFDKSNNRLGRGKGFYDKLLPLLQCRKIGLCFNFQFFDAIPAEPHDIKVDEVIC